MTSKEINEIQKIIVENLHIIAKEAKKNKVALQIDDIKKLANQMEDELIKQIDKKVDLPKEIVEDMAREMTENIIDSMEHLTKVEKKEILETKLEKKKETEQHKKKNIFKERLKIGALAGTLGIAAGVGATMTLQPEDKGYQQSHVAEKLQGETDEFTQNWEEIEQDYNDYQKLIAQDETDLSPAQKAEMQVLEERLAKSKENLQDLVLQVAKNVVSKDVGKEVKEIYIVAGKLGSNRYVYNDGTKDNVARTTWPDIKDKEAIKLMEEYNKLTYMPGLKEYGSQIALKTDKAKKLLDYQKELAQKNAKIFGEMSEAQEKVIQEQQTTQTQSEKDDGMEIE